MINTPRRGIGNKTIERLMTYAASSRLSVLDAIGRIEQIEQIGPRPRKLLRELAAMIMRAIGVRRPLVRVPAWLGHAVTTSLNPILGDVVCLHMNPARFDGRVRFDWRV